MHPSSINLTSLVPTEDNVSQRGRRRVEPTNSSISGELPLSSLEPQNASAPPSGRAPSPDRWAPSALNESTLLPQDPQPAVPKYYSQQANAVHNAGNSMAHVTGGKQHVTAPSTTAWVDVPDGAGHSSRHAARLETRGSQHFFGQPVYTTNADIGSAPFHGPRHYSSEQSVGAIAPDAAGMPNPSVAPGEVSDGLRADAHPATRRGRREVPVPVASEADAQMPLTPGGRRQTQAHRETFGGQTASSLIYGGY